MNALGIYFRWMFAVFADMSYIRAIEQFALVSKKLILATRRGEDDKPPSNP